MQKPQKTLPAPKVTEVDLTGEVERILEPKIREFYQLHPEYYDPKYNPAGWVDRPEEAAKNVSGF
jgi:hypothetical protein